MGLCKSSLRDAPELLQDGGGRECDWSEMPQDILNLILQQLCVEDHINFVKVCKSWKSSADLPFQHPWLLLTIQPSTTSSSSSVCRFLAEKNIEIPLRNQSNSCCCIGSIGNWLVIIDHNLNLICIVNLFSKVKFHLPSQPPSTEKEDLFRKVVLSGSPHDSSCVAAAISFFGSLSIARPGDSSWKCVSTMTKIAHDIIFYDGKLYGIDADANLFEYDIDCLCRSRYFPNRFGTYDNSTRFYLYYLVEMSGSLLLVARYIHTKTKKNCSFVVRKLQRNFCLNMSQVTSLGRYALFVGMNTSVAVLATKSSSIKPNCIYFSDKSPLIESIAGVGVGVFQLKKRALYRPPEKIHLTLQPCAPAVWIVPTSKNLSMKKQSPHESWIGTLKEFLFEILTLL